MIPAPGAGQTHSRGRAQKTSWLSTTPRLNLGVLTVPVNDLEEGLGQQAQPHGEIHGAHAARQKVGPHRQPVVQRDVVRCSGGDTVEVL